MATKTILVADDDPSTRELISLILEDEGYRVVTAVNGLETVEKAREIHPDLIVMDIMMPEMDGYEALNKIKDNEDLVDTPVLIITARTIKIYERISRGLGAVDHITKPFSPDALARKVRETVGD